MVQILRDSMRNYEADVSGAIRTSQIAANIGEWNQVIQGAGRIAGSIMERQADEAAAQQKLAEQTDEDIINTQIGQQANIAAQQAITKKLDANVDPNSESFKSFIESTYASAYAPYLEKMSTERGKISLETMMRKGADKSLSSAIDWYASEKQIKAREARDALVNAQNFSAKQLGQIGDYETFKNKGNEAKDVIVKSLEKDGVPKDLANLAVSAENANSFIGGLAESDPVSAAALVGADDQAKDAVVDIIRSQNPDWSERDVEKAVKQVYDAKNADSNAKLNDLYGDEAIQTLKDNEKKRLEEQLKNATKGSQNYKDTADELKKLEKDDNYVYDKLREDLRNQFGAQIDKRVEEIILENKNAQYIDDVNSVADIMRPTLTSLLFNPVERVKVMQEALKSFSGEVNPQKIEQEVQTFAENAKTVKQEKFANVTGTKEVKKALVDLSESEELTPAQLVYKALEVQNAAYDAPITERQRKDLNTIAYNMVKDKGFSDLVSATLKNPDLYYSDFNASAMLGTIANNYTTSPKANETIVNALDAGSYKLYENAVAQIAEITTLPKEQQPQAMKEVENYIIAGKKKIYDDTIGTYGINLKNLDEQLKNTGRAFANINGIEYVYSGRDGNGNPVFDMSMFGIKGNEGRKSFMERIGLLKPESKKAE